MSSSVPEDEDDDLICSMVIECCEKYHARRKPDGGLSIVIEVDPRFALLWLTKLSDLRASDEEIREHEQE